MKLLITGAWNCKKAQLDEISALGHDVVFMQNEGDSLPCDYSQVEGVICNGIFLHHDIQKFTSLKFIQLTSAGFDRVPMDYVKQKGIKIFNARGVYAAPMAEFALCGVLQLYKQTQFFCRNQKGKKWVKNRGLKELFGKTICIVGSGNVGTECAKRFNAFDCSVLGVDIFPREDENYKKIYHLSEIDNCLKVADVVVLTLPLTEETRHLINKTRLDNMKDGAVLVNIARGAVVDTVALIEALNQKLLGAVLDVFETEPLAEKSPLWDMQNVIITPHNSFVSDGNDDRLDRVIIGNIEEQK